LTEIAGEEWRDEPELLGAVGSAGDLLGDVRFHPDLAEQLSAVQIERVRTEMAGIREARIDIWKAWDRVSPATTCLGTLCIYEDGTQTSEPNEPVPEDGEMSSASAGCPPGSGKASGRWSNAAGSPRSAVSSGRVTDPDEGDSRSAGHRRVLQRCAGPRLGNIGGVLPSPDELAESSGVTDPEVIEAAFALWDTFVDEAIDGRRSQGIGFQMMGLGSTVVRAPHDLLTRLGP